MVRSPLAGSDLTLWYLDDGHLIGRLSILEESMRTLKERAGELGIQLNATKCCLWGPGVNTAELPERYPSLSEVQVVPWEEGRGIKVLALPVSRTGELAFGRSLLKDITDRLAEGTSLLDQLGDFQAQHLLLQYCLDA